jgi:hypothetical protein
VKLTPKPLLAAPRRSRRRVGLALLAITAVAIAVGVILGASPTGSSRGADPAARSSGATTVQRRKLIATDTESGTLSYADPQTVFNRLSGTITWLPQVGDVIKPGQALYRVDGAPVILFTGSVPAYRTLTDGISDGADVKELKRNLKALGFDPSSQITVNDTFDSATTDAIDRWQSSLGETQTGAVALGQVVFLPGAQRITAVEAALGGTGSSGNGSGSGAGGGAGESPGAGGGAGESSGASGAGGTGTAASGAGSGGGGVQPILSTTSTKLIVSVDLDATKQTEAAVGEPVTVELPSGRTVDGKITKVSPVAQRGSSGSSGSDSGSGGGGSSTPSATIPVTIALRKGQRVTGLDQAAVSVNFEKQVERNVLSVPVTALLATAGGGYAVQEAAARHRLIPVTVSLFAAGYVQISGPGVYAGLQVTDSQG